MAQTAHSRNCSASRPRSSARNRLPLVDWLALARQRRLLATLDADRLDDIGLTRDEALREARRPFWDRG
ncbi:DUF1127 domain-containing protein [Roseovarius sp. C7]|uniref:DUF1127 domain-containing protein n=1 Tax=Roseovarius sp. C7 TaxID=3398643 RepID=UPI0039F6FBB8